MTYAYDMVLSNALVVDPANNVNRVTGIAICGEAVAEVGDDLEVKARTVVDLDGMLAMPGIIDVHTHLTSFFGGSDGGFHMLAKAGVCTALDLAGPTADFLDTMRRAGSGINAACLESVRPGDNVSGKEPTRTELDSFISACLDGGALGAKLLGGHYPLTPEASRDFVAAARDQGAYAAWHAGTTQTCNTVASLAELLELSEGRHIHVPHVNSYCRGMTRDALEEVAEAFALLERHPNAFSEAYLSESNGTTFAFTEDGRMKSNSTGRILDYHGFGDSPQGLERALRAGFARLFVPKGLETVALHGEAAVAYFRANGNQANGGFNVNPAAPRVALCLGKKANGDFRIDAISTDGGAIPRNVIVSHGLSLVTLAGLTLEEFVIKTSYNPSRMLNMPQKGHLAPGADADVTVVNPTTRTPVMTVALGTVCMAGGVVTGRGGTVYTTSRGRGAVEASGLPARIIDPSDGPLRFRKD